MGTPIALATRLLNDVQTEPISGRALWAMGNIGPAELIAGEIKYLMPTGRLHGRIEITFAALVLRYLLENRIGEVYTGEVGIYTRRNPDTVRAADVVYISNERLQKTPSESYLEVAPELVVEVMSPNDRWSEVYEKIDEYFAVGVTIVLVIDPRPEFVRVYRSPDDVVRLNKTDELTLEEILPGFRVPVASIFSYGQPMSK